MQRRSFQLLAVLFSLLAACDSTKNIGAPTRSVLSFDIEDELEQGAVLVDVRGVTERRRDGVSASPHVWLPFGPDDWRPPTSEEQAAFITRVAQDDALRGRRLLALCSVGVRSAAASHALISQGYDVQNVNDGWLGTNSGPGLRETERSSQR